jgi:serine-type D-Ala-D-Ala carboxypeptidase/endopeptidase
MRTEIHARRMRLSGVLAALVFAVTALHANADAPTAAPREWQVPSNDAIHALLVERMRHNGVGIVVGIVDANGRRIVSYGRSGADDERVLDGDAVFQIGSATKCFTALLLADMVVRGEVALDDPVQKYLPAGVRMPVRGRAITLRDLATHMSGLPSMPTNLSLSGKPDPYAAYTMEQFWDFLSTYSLPREPGARSAYSNFGVTLLGHVLALRAGKDYEVLLRERVLAPLRMRSTSIALNRDQQRRLIPGHDRYLRPVRTWEMRNMPASGSLRSTAHDSLNLLAAYLGLDESPLQAAMALQLREKMRLTEIEGWQALGWFIGMDGNVSHAGGKQGYRSGYAFNPHTKVGVVVLANARTDDQPLALAHHLVSGRPLPAATSAPTTRVARVSRATLNRYAGTYRYPAGETVEVGRMDGYLLVHAPGNGVSEFLPASKTDFFLNGGNDELTFVRDERGRATAFHHYGDGRAAGNSELAVRVDTP